MANELKIIRGGRSAERCSEAPKTGEAPTAVAVPEIPEQLSDKVSLSKLYHVIQSSASAIRLQSLGLQVDQQTYLIPSAEISRSLMREHLQAA